MPERVLVAEIVAPFGVRGEVKVVALMDDLRHLKKLGSVVGVFPDATETVFKIKSLRPHQRSWILLLDGWEDRDTVEALRNVRLYLRPDEMPPLEPDAFYEWQLVGLRVETESGKDLGRIEKVYFHPANDVYETDVALIPAVMNEIIRSVDLEAGLMVVRDIIGLRKDEE